MMGSTLSRVSGRNGRSFRPCRAILHSQTVASAQSTLLNTTFGWNAVNDLASITDQVTPANSYGFQYDAVGRLQEATGPYRTPQSFALAYGASSYFSQSESQASVMSRWIDDVDDGQTAGTALLD